MKSLFVCVLAAVLSGTAASGALRLVWEDTFDGPALDCSKWAFEVGVLRNTEKQYYTDGRPENCRIEDGKLVIEARKEPFGKAAYTSASIHTHGLVSARYGRIECRAKVPEGRGLWPAFWTLGDNWAEVGWPRCGEIDIMEYVGYDTTRTWATAHWWEADRPGEESHVSVGTSLYRSKVRPGDGFHTYALEWDEKKLVFFFDDIAYLTLPTDKIPSAGGIHPFRQGHGLKLNLAVGGEWGGREGIDDAVFPARYEIDWVRVWAPEEKTAAAVTPDAAIRASVEATARRLTADMVALRAGKGDQHPDFRGAYPVTAYKRDVVLKDGVEIWTEALRRALAENAYVFFPARDAPYVIDDTVLVPSHRRIDAWGATIRLADGTTSCLLRNARSCDGTHKPITGEADETIGIYGGRWEDWAPKRLGYGATGKFDAARSAYGVSTLFLFNNLKGFVLKDATFVRTGGFAVQIGDVDGATMENIRFVQCWADGLHVNGNTRNVLIRDVKGEVGDDLVALNAYDWLNSSVDFGSIDTLLCEDLELAASSPYKAIRIQPGIYTYDDGTQVDCAVRNVVMSKVRGVNNFKMYLQTPAYDLAEGPERGAPGSGGNLWFEDIVIDLNGPIDRFDEYVKGDAVRGHFGAFEFGSNLTDVHFRDIDIRFYADRYPLSHLATVGPKSIRAWGGKEVFDPYVSCDVGVVALENIRLNGVAPTELVHATVFENVNGDGRSSGRGRIGKIETIGEAR